MNKLMTLAIATVAMMLASCEEKDIKLYPTMDYTTTAFVHGQGSYSEEPNISVSDLRQAINDLEGDGEVTDLMIEGIYLKITRNGSAGYPNTTATSGSGYLSITSWEGQETAIVNNLQIDLTKETQEINLRDYLNKAGVQILKNMAYAVAKDSVPDGKNFISISLSGAPSPSTGYVNAKIEVVVKIAVEYTQHIDAVL